MVQVVPSSSPKQTSSTPINSWVTELCGAFRHDVSFPRHGPLTVPWGDVSRSGEMST
jgi:hypothetical protein